MPETSFNQGIIDEFRANAGIVSRPYPDSTLVLVTMRGAKSGREMTLPLEIPLRFASRGYSGLTCKIGVMPRRTASFGGAGGGGAMTGGAITGGSGGGVGVTAEMTGSDCTVGTGTSGGGT